MQPGGSVEWVRKTKAKDRGRERKEASTRGEEIGTRRVRKELDLLGASQARRTECNAIRR